MSDAERDARACRFPSFVRDKRACALQMDRWMDGWMDEWQVMVSVMVLVMLPRLLSFSDGGWCCVALTSLVVRRKFRSRARRPRDNNHARWVRELDAACGKAAQGIGVLVPYGTVFSGRACARGSGDARTCGMRLVFNRARLCVPAPEPFFWNFGEEFVSVRHKNVSKAMSIKGFQKKKSMSFARGGALRLRSGQSLPKRRTTGSVHE